MPTSRDYIPASPDTFNVYQENFVTQVDQNYHRWNIDWDTTVMPLRNWRDQWNAVYPKAVNSQNRTSADVLERKECQADYTRFIRTFANQNLAHNPLVTDPDKERLGLHVHSNTRHPAPTPTTAPVVIKIDSSESQQHTIYFANEGGNLAKPDGVHGCEIYMKKGDAPVSDTEYTFAGTDTRSPFVMKFDESELGQIVHYKLRWVNTRGEHGPWSKQVSAIVA
jgi:hypothetical protein